MNNRAQILIESYFSGQLSEAELRELQELLATDEAVAAEFAWQQNLAKQVSKLSLSGSIQNKTLREATKPPFLFINMKRSLWAAAATIALIAAAAFFINHEPIVDKNTAMAQAFEHFPNKMRFKNMGGNDGETVDPDVLQAFSFYDKKDYYMAAPMLKDVVNSHTDRLEYRFYLGVSELALNNYAECINALFSVTQDKNSPYATPAHYYIGVAYARINDVKQAKTHLQAYIDAEDGVTFRDKAKKLLITLK